MSEPATVDYQAAADAPAAAPRSLGALLSDSASLAWERAGAYGALVACGVVPGIILLGAGAFLTGILDRDSLQAALDAGRYADVGLVASLTLLGGLIRVLSLLALAVALAARLEGEALSLDEAFEGAVGFVGALLAAEIRVFLWVLGGLFLLIVPGLVVAVRCSQTHWAVLLEGRRGAAALERSKEIMLAHTGKMIGNLLVCGLCVLALTVAASLTASLLLGVVFGVPEGQPLGQTLAAGLMANLIQGLAGVWGMAFSILLYKDMAAQHPAINSDALQGVEQ